MKKVGHVKAGLFDGFVIIAFSKKWLDLFERKPEFDIFVDKNRIHLVSDQKVAKPETV